MKLLALDYGARRCGVAVSDPSGTLARPLATIERVGSPAGLAALLELIEREAPERIVIGLPLTPGGAEGAQAASTRAFAGRLRGRCPIPIELVDERLTTSIARTRGTTSTTPEDARAAAVLLEDVLHRDRG